MSNKGKLVIYIIKFVTGLRFWREKGKGKDRAQSGKDEKLINDIWSNQNLAGSVYQWPNSINFYLTPTKCLNHNSYPLIWTLTCANLWFWH